MQSVRGLHHVTAISGPAQQNLDFYAGILGMRLVKESVNQDDPGTYHLFYADAEGHPGTDLTFFPWEQLAPPVMGHGLTNEVLLEVPNDSVEFWTDRLKAHEAAVHPAETRFGSRVLPLTDPHGLKVVLVEDPRPRQFTPWRDSPVAEQFQIRGLYGARVWERDAAATSRFLERELGFTQLGAENGWTRYGVADGAGVIDVRETPEERRGRWGTGSVHHLAWRVDDDEHQQAVREQVLA